MGQPGKYEKFTKLSGEWKGGGELAHRQFCLIIPAACDARKTYNYPYTWSR